VRRCRPPPKILASAIRGLPAVDGLVSEKTDQCLSSRLTVCGDLASVDVTKAVWG
jgi:hypothetical protein